MPEETKIITKPAAVSSSWRKLAAVAFPMVIAASVLLAYWTSLHNEFIRLDDHVTVYQNPKLIRLSWSDMKSFWCEPQLALYTPLTYTLFALIATFSSTNAFARHAPPYPFHPMGFHAVDLGLHMMSALVVYALLCRLIGRRFGATVGALIFALHPVQVESVSWVTETNNLLCGLFSLLAVYFYLLSIQGGRSANHTARTRRGWFILATEVYLLALFSKPLGVIVPILAAVVHWLAWTPSENPSPEILDKRAADASPVLDYESEHGGRRRPIPWKLAIWLAIAVPFAVVARTGQPVPANLYTPLWMRPLIAGDAISFYLYKIFYPRLLLPDYDRSPRVIQEFGWIYYTWIFAALVGLAVLWAWRRWRARPVLAGALWFIIALLPVLGLTPFVYQAISTVADRYLYLPMFGVALCAAWIVDRAMAAIAQVRTPLASGIRVATIAVTVVVLTLLAVRTSRQTRYWHDSTLLFGHTKRFIGRDPGAQEWAPAPDQMPVHDHRRPT